MRREGRVDHVPVLAALGEHDVLRLKNARIVERADIEGDEIGPHFGLAKKMAAAVGAEMAEGALARLHIDGEALDLAGHAERVFGDGHRREVARAGRFLTVAAVAMDTEHWLAAALVAHSPAQTSARDHDRSPARSGRDHGLASRPDQPASSHSP